MSTHLITTLWGIPVTGIAATNQALPDSVLELAKGTPSPADTFLWMPPNKRPADSAWLGAPPLHRFSTSPLRVSSDNWSLPVPIEIVKPPKASGTIRRIAPNESAEDYVAVSLNSLLARVVREKKYGFSKSDADKMIGDLWFVLDQLTAAKKTTDSFWIWILNELMWGDVLEKPSNRDMADAIVNRF
ncbi:MAG: hypothetical protein Q8P84_05695, partial [Deltaproteobacteria bacterium]|nr:hypothetical protein [Deltaproteobacteria bacterium]